MRGVTGDATLNLRGGMFKDERPPLFDVALNASFRPALHEFGAVGTTVRIVTVRAFQGAFGDTVMRGQCELGLDITVALVAEFGLGLYQLAAVQPAVLLRQFRNVEEIALGGADGFGLWVPASFDQMHGVAAIAGDPVLNVAGVPEVLLIAAALVAYQAAFGVLLGIRME